MSETTEKLLTAYSNREVERAKLRTMLVENLDIPTVVEQAVRRDGLTRHTLEQYDPQKAQSLGKRVLEAYFDMADIETIRANIWVQEDKARKCLLSLAGKVLQATTIDDAKLIRADRWNGEDFIHGTEHFAQASGVLHVTAYHPQDDLDIVGSQRRWYGGGRKTLYHVPLVQNITGEPLVRLEEVS